MGRKNKNYQKDLHQQAFEKFKSMEAFGTSKKEAMMKGDIKNKIFSYNTFNTYWKHAKYFIGWIQENHPECKTLKSAKKYVNEWLNYRAASKNQKGEPLSSWTLHTEAKAIGKLYGISPDDPDYYVPPVRVRNAIKRSRNDVKRDAHFSEIKNKEFVTFCEATGLRRSEITKLKGKDLVSKRAIEHRINTLDDKGNMTDDEKKQLKMLIDTRLFPDTEYFVYTVGKGGRPRLSPIIGDQHTIQAVVDKIASTDRNAKVWAKVPANADIHSYRSVYATAIYHQFARSISLIPYDAINNGTGHKYQSQVYICRKDSYKKLDRSAMLKASKALGHNRLDVVATNYLRNL